MSAFGVLWLVVAAYVVFEVARAIRAILLNPGTTVTFHWPFLILCGTTTSLGIMHLTGAIR